MERVGGSREHKSRVEEKHWCFCGVLSWPHRVPADIVRQCYELKPETLQPTGTSTMGHPPRLTGTTLACLLLLFAVAESASKCSTGCHGMHPSKAYQEGKTYVYNLDGLSVTSVTDAQGDASLKLAATVELSVKPDCVHQLRLKNVQINGAPPSTSDVEQYAVQFNYHDGHIDTEICAEPGDSQASLNIKRAVVSLFQSAIMQDSGSRTYHETDVMGACPTDFNFRKEGESTMVHKSRNLAQCAFRENVNQGLISGSMDMSAGVKSSPVLASQQEVEQVFKRGVLNKAISKETYKLRPFSSGNAGAKTAVTTTLTLKSEKGDNPPAAVSQPKSLIFEAPHPVLKSSPDAIGKALKAASAEVTNEVKPEAADKFSQLVKVLRLSNKDDILSVYHKVKAGAGFNKEDQKVLLDAVFRTGSGEAAEVGVELVKNKEITGVQAMLFYASLALVRHVHLPSVAAITSLLDQPNLPRLGYLGVGQVIGKYCKDHACENVPEVKQAVHKIREKVGNGKAKTRDHENLIVSALKALGNTNFLDDATLQKLANIAADKNVKNRVRVAAIEALPARCSMKWKNILFNVLGDKEEDSEVRIKTYLSLVACPCQHVAHNLKEVLNKEPVKQVGSFIQTHLRNLRASTDPSKLDAKNHLGLIKPKIKYPEDFRKYSFNNELSHKIDAFGLGSSVESNVIYSQNSFVPRSMSLNMSVELFGHNFNFLELDTRVENMDRVIEHYFGPKGKLWEKDLEEMSVAGASTASKLGNLIKDKYEKIIRGKREVKRADLDKFAKNVKLRSNEVDQDLDLDLSVKLFGVEAAYLSYQGDTNKLTPEAIIDEIFNSLKKGLDLAKNLNYDLKSNLQFLDAELIYPTGLGSALNLGLTGTSSMKLKTHGKMDIPAILKNPKKANFEIALEPSVSVQVVGNMIVQAPGVESGMKIINTLHTSTSSDLSVSMLDGKGVDVTLGVPKKKQELISMSSEVLMSSGPKGNKYVAPKFPKGKQYADCFDQLIPLMGLTVCGQISFPYSDINVMQQKPMFPLSGPAKIEINLKNDDVTNYHFKVYLNTDDPKKRSFEILFDTPKSKTDRHVSLLLEAGLEPHMYAKAALDTPLKKASAEVVLKNVPQERSLSVTILHDQIKYFGQVGVVAQGSKYKPILKYEVPEHIERLAGAAPATKGQQYNVEGTVDVSDYQGGQKYVLDKVALVIAGNKLVTVDGSVAWTPNSVNVDANVGYADKSLALKLNGKVVSANNYMLSVSTMPSTDPNIGFNLKWEFNKGQDEVENNLVFIHGPDQNSATNRLTLKQKATYRLNRADLLLSTSNELTYPALNLKLKFDGKVVPKSLSGDLEVKYDSFNIGTELSVKIDMEKPGDYEVELEAELMQNSVELKARRTIVDNTKSKFANSLVLKPGGKYDADATVVYDVSKNNVNVQLEGDMNLNGKKVKVDTGLEANAQVVNSKLFVKVDGTKYIEFILRTKRQPNPSGSLTLNLKNYLTASGQYNYQNNKGTANLNIDVPKVNRKIKATGNLAVSGSEHVGNVELLYDAEKDPSKRIKLSTISDITKSSVDTKNVLEILTYKLEVNGKGKLRGTFSDGELQVEADVTLPNGRYLVLTGKRKSVKKDSTYDIKVNSELKDYEKKGGPSRSLSYTADAKNLNTADGTFQVSGKLKYVDVDGKDTYLAYDTKNLKKNDKKQHGLDLEVGGATVPKKVNLQFDCDHGNKDTTFSAKCSLGSDYSFTSSGTWEKGNEVDKPDKMNGVMEMKLPNEKLSNLKLELTSSVLDSDEKDLVENSDSLKLTYNNDKTIKMDSYLKLVGLNKVDVLDKDVPSEGTGKLNLNVLDLPALKMQGNYKYNPTPEKKTAVLDMNAQYGEKEVSFKADNEYLPTVAIVRIKAKSNLNLEKLKKVALQLTYKRLKEENKVTVDSEVNADGTKYTLNSEVQHQEANNLFHVTINCPHGKTEILSKFEKLGDTEFKGEWKVITPKAFVVADGHVNLQSIDDFVINANIDSDKIKHRKIHAEITNKAAPKTGKRIVITVTSDGQNIVTGSTNYKVRNEDGKVVVEGNGNLQIGDNTRSSSFKYTRQQLTKEKDGEIGVAIVLNANFGPSAVVGELKLTNKEVHMFNSYCEQNKDCAQFKLQSILDIENKKLLKHQLTVEVDLKKFNVPAEFGLKTSTELNNPIFDHTTKLYLHSTKDKSEYTYKLYIHNKESAAILTLPSREMALVLIYDLPKTKHTGSYKVDLSLYLDKKNKPADKTSLSATGDINIHKDSLSLSGETKFSYPTQPKDMVVKGALHCGQEQLLNANLDIDVFAKKSQKISIVANVQNQPLPQGKNITGLIEVNSRGQQLKLDLKSHLAFSTKQIGFGSLFTYNDVNQKPKTMGTLFSADMNHISLLVTLPDKPLIKDDWKMDISKNAQKINRQFSVLGGAPNVMNLEATDMNKFKFEGYSKDNPNNKLSVNGQVVLGQLAEIHADIIKNGAKKNLFRVLVHLDEKHFLKPDFAYNQDNVAELLNVLKNKNLDLAKKMKELNEYVAKEVKAEGTDFVDHLKKAQPNMKPLLEYYQGELDKLKNEISADETVKEIQDTLNKYLGVVVAAVTDTMKQVAKGVEKLQHMLNEIMANLKNVADSMTPQLKESYNKVFNKIMEICNAVAKLADTYLKVVLNLINEHQKEIQDIMSVVSGMVQDFAKIITKGLEQIKQSVNQMASKLVNQLKALPIYEMAKEKLEALKELEIPEYILSPVEELCKAMRGVLPTEELRQFLDDVCQYVAKHVKREKIDEVAELKKIYSHMVSAVQSILDLMQQQVTLDNVLGFVQIQAPDFSLLSKLPGIATLRVSLFNLLRNGELPTPMELFYTYRPSTHIHSIVPPFRKSGVVADGGHFFTFDGRHLTMPGTCTYVLAQDMQDGNFSVVANFNDGVLISVTITEPEESITLKNNGNILVNNKPSDYPANTKNLHAYLVDPFANVKSEYGVRVTCSDKAPMICAVHVSGFYLGKVRGILGDGNNEPYDDFTLPSGKITENAADFGNAYKLKGDCADAAVVEHKARAPVCTELFSGQSSPLKSCFNYVNPALYRDACDHAVAAKTQEGSCLIATAYVYTCYTRGIMMEVPSSCISCKVGANKVDVGDAFSVKIPKKEADIVFVVEQQMPNDKVFKEMVTPLMSELREELKQQGLTDVHIGLIGYSEKMKWPQHYTLNGDTNIQGEVKNIKFDEQKPTITLEEAKTGDAAKKIDYLHQRLDVELGTFKLTDAYEEAIRYPFRPGAAKAVIGILAKPCEKSPLFLSLQQLRILVGHKIYRDLGLTYHHVSYPHGLLVNGKPQKNIVGYDQESVYTFADSKKKPLTGSAEMKSNLAPAVNDVCADFAVSSGGAAFSAENFLDGKSNQRKQFIQVVAKRVTDGLVNLELEEDCACKTWHAVAARPQCKIVGRKEAPRPTKAMKG